MYKRFRSVDHRLNGVRHGSRNGGDFMQPSHENPIDEWILISSERRPRLRLKPKALPTGFVDGAWWPRRADLATELPDLLTVLSIRLGRIGSVAYGSREWAKAPDRIVIGDSLVRLSGSRRRESNTVEILGASGTSIMLLVVPPHTEAGRAHDTMMAAAEPGDASTTDSLLCARSA